ncbi:hypothetical protein A9Q84_17465 [Halobacteriovorax marinus]|uniref:Oxidoreductase molybdopterin-binding domain-containing protein n=1 Tax=Halobacteriovorax marinus TaxID=97084 RepID=A0A1Y5F701_9BACT|nr:hypothetical protein A9Q84_17465 [Halobacteriovorax marinus]
MKIIQVLLLCSISFSIFAEKVPRQKVYIKGLVKAEKTYKMNELSTLPQIEIKIIDPYSKNQEINFKGVLLSEIFRIHASKAAKKIRVIAINDYKVEIPIELAKKEKMILAYRGDGKYLSVSNRGPARIVIPGKGILDEGSLANAGLNWVWFVKTIEFIK